MIDLTTHLTEDERHTAADGTLPAERRASVEAHLAGCDTCAADVARITEFMKRTRELTQPVSTSSLEELWSPIRTRIEATKVVSLGGTSSKRSTGPLALFALVGISAAMLLATLVLRAPRHAPQDAAAIGQATPDSSALRAVTDSARAYEAEAQILLDRLEIQRATLRPETVKEVERNLRTVDVAIAELKDAIARDPRNTALRQLLATSYRQKVELLKRAANAG